ncbi:MAG: hypothetical protein NUV51_03990 [Sulfuricaulis sp.]|nr:hypothetical protein [Sulfuricaulis sp.]
MSEARYVCPGCHNEFLQPFKCTTCGAQKLYDCTLRSAEERAAELETALAVATAEAEHWKRMYECAQNANAHRQSAIEGYEQEAERNAKDARRHQFAMRHVSYYSAFGEFIVDCRRKRPAGSDASLDYEKDIDTALTERAEGKEG